MDFLIKASDLKKLISINDCDISDIEESIIESATLAIDYFIKNDKKHIPAVLIVEVNDDIYTLNSYVILCNASYFKEAEVLRLFSLKEYGVDLKLEPIINRSKLSGL